MAIFRIPPPVFVGGHQPYAPHEAPPSAAPVLIWFQMDSSTMPDIVPVKKEMIAY